MHDLRHTAAALMISTGAHPEAIKRQLGHSSIKVTMDVYGHLFPSDADKLTFDLDDLYRKSQTGKRRTKNGRRGSLQRSGARKVLEDQGSLFAPGARVELATYGLTALSVRAVCNRAKPPVATERKCLSYLLLLWGATKHEPMQETRCPRSFRPGCERQAREPNSDVNAVRTTWWPGSPDQELLNENFLTIQACPSAQMFGDNSSERSLPDG